MTDSEVNLIKRAQEGDMTAFSDIVNAYSHRVLSLSMRFLSNPKDAEDISQEVFLKIYDNIKSFRFESKFYTWVYRIVVNLCYNHRKKQSRMQYTEPGEADNFWERLPADGDNGVDASLRDETIRNAVDDALEDLSSQQRTVFIMKFYEGQKIKDIAALLDLTEGTVKRYLFRATQKLRVILEPLR